MLRSRSLPIARWVRVALVGAVAAGVPVSVLAAAQADANPWLAYFALVAAAAVVIFMLLREAFSDSRDEDDIRHQTMRHDAPESAHNDASKRRLA